MLNSADIKRIIARANADKASHLAPDGPPEPALTPLFHEVSIEEGVRGTTKIELTVFIDFARLPLPELSEADRQAIERAIVNDGARRVHFDPTNQQAFSIKSGGYSAFQHEPDRIAYYFNKSEAAKLKKLVKLWQWTVVPPLPPPSPYAPRKGGLANKRGDFWSLDLSDRKLEELPKEVLACGELQSLELCRNAIATLPKKIGALTELQELWLCQNQLEELPAEIGSLVHLDILHIDRNRLTALPPSIGNLTKLEILEADGNAFTSLPAEIGKLTKLRELRLDGNPITSLPPEIGELHNLEKLLLVNCDLTGLPPEMANLKKLKSLSIKGNKRMKVLPPWLTSLDSLAWIELSAGLRKQVQPLMAHFPKLIVF